MGKTETGRKDRNWRERHEFDGLKPNPPFSEEFVD